MDSIIFTVELREKLRAAYEEAVDRDAETFEFEGHVFLVRYAMYLLQHLDNVLGK